MDHGPMKNVSLQFKGGQWRDWHGAAQTVPPVLRRVAHAFFDLQDDRVLADYDNHESWTVDEVRKIVAVATGAFNDWRSVRTDPIAGDYLLSMLLCKRR
jgi:hypothetical protein